MELVRQTEVKWQTKQNKTKKMAEAGLESRSGNKDRALNPPNFLLPPKSHPGSGANG